jgi:hypothetical protein
MIFNKYDWRFTRVMGLIIISLALFLSIALLIYRSNHIDLLDLLIILMPLLLGAILIITSIKTKSNLRKKSNIEIANRKRRKIILADNILESLEKVRLSLKDNAFIIFRSDSDDLDYVQFCKESDCLIFNWPCFSEDTYGLNTMENVASKLLKLNPNVA